MNNGRRFPLIFIAIGLIAMLTFIFNLKKDKSLINDSKYLNFIRDIQKPRNIIFDLGAHIGDSALFFADPSFVCDKPAGCHELQGICTKNNKTWIMHSFEMNPEYNNHLDNVSKVIQSLGHTHFLYKETAAWIQNENLTFYIDGIITLL